MVVVVEVEVEEVDDEVGRELPPFAPGPVAADDEHAPSTPPPSRSTGRIRNHRAVRDPGLRSARRIVVGRGVIVGSCLSRRS